MAGYVKSQLPGSPESYTDYLEQQLRAIEQALAAQCPNLATAPLSPQKGQRYFDTTLGKNRTWDGTLWQNWW